MTIDVRTILLIIGLTHLMQIAIFVYQFKINKTYKGIGWWLMWSIAETIGFSIMLFWDIPSFFKFVATIQNTALVAGTIFIYIGIKRFLGEKENLKVIVPIFITFEILFLFLLFIYDNIQIRQIIIYLALSTMLFLVAFSLFKVKMVSIKTTAKFNAVVFIIHACAVLFHGIWLIVDDSATDILGQRLINDVQFLEILTVSLFWTIGFIIMINQRLNAEMVESKEHFELIFNTSPDAAIISRLEDGYILNFNTQLLSLTDYTPEEVRGNTSIGIQLWLNSEDRHKFTNELKEKGYCENFESKFRRKDGKEMTGLVSAKIIKLQGIDYIISITRDITERKQMEDAIRKSDKNYKQVIETANEGIVLAEPDGKYYFVNRKMADLLGYTADELTGKKSEELAFEDFKKDMYGERKILKEGKVTSGEFKFKRKDGSEFWSYYNASAIYDENGNHIGNLAMHTDITERKKSEEKIVKYIEELKAKNNELKQFNNAMVGRELKMIELKKEINEICKKIGEPIRY